ncbi:MAG: DUF4386 domain-containing protein [Bacteroidales bacterium]|nr:MAG: DUF4386 domain-containing protein [Bacteroidales bacterium]
MNSLKKNARIAGLLYFFLAITAVYGSMYVPSHIMVRGDTVATIKNILSNEFFYRTGIFSNLISITLFVFLVLALYRLLKDVNEHQAKLMVGLVFVGIPVAFLFGVFKIIALNILNGNLSFQPEQMNNLAMIFIKIGSYGSPMISLYWGLWLIPLGLLVYKSGFIPRLLGILLIINGMGYAVDCFTAILFPDYYAIVSKYIFVTYFIGEIPLILWLLIIGIKVKKRLSTV